MYVGPQRDLKEDGDSAKEKGGLGICEACSRWQVRLGGASALTVGDCARAQHLVYVFIYLWGGIPSLCPI